MQNIIVKNIDNTSLCFQIPRQDLDDNVLNLKQLIFEKIGIPALNQTLISHGKILNDNLPLEQILSLTNISLHLALKGGKGGFGSLLRGQAATKRKITNFDASRDLQGRRIRNVDNHKKLLEWLRKKKEEDERIKHELEEFKEMQKNVLSSQRDPRLSQEFKEKLEK